MREFVPDNMTTLLNKPERRHERGVQCALDTERQPWIAQVVYFSHLLLEGDYGQEKEGAETT